MQSLQHSQITSQTTSDLDSKLNDQTLSSLTKSSSFSPFLANSLKPSDNAPVNYLSISYCQKQNLIIAFSLYSTLEFYDATTLRPFKERTQNLDEVVICWDYSSETDTFLLGCDSGSIYSYSPHDNKLEKLQECANCVSSVVFLNAPFYAFSEYKSRKISLAALNNDSIEKFGSRDSNSVSLCHLSKSNLLLSRESSGFVRIYHAKNVSSVRVLCSVRAHLPVISSLTIQNITIKGKELVVTVGRDPAVKIWHLLKGRMRLLRVIETEGYVDSLVYLDKYKMIAIVCESSKEILFYNVFSGKLERTFGKNREPICGLFLMKDKNMIGVIEGIPGRSRDSIEFIQLHRNGGE